MTHWNILEKARRDNALAPEQAIEALVGVLAEKMGETEFSEVLSNVLNTDSAPHDGDFICSSCGLVAFHSTDGLRHHRDTSAQEMTPDDELDSNHLPTKPSDVAHSSVRSGSTRSAQRLPTAPLPTRIYA